MFVYNCMDGDIDTVYEELSGFFKSSAIWSARLLDLRAISFSYCHA